MKITVSACVLACLLGAFSPPQARADFAPGVRVPQGSSTLQYLLWSAGAGQWQAVASLSPAALGSQSANTVLAGPGSGAANSAGFRALTSADLPATTGTVRKFAALLGAITANTAIVVPHGLGTADCTWNVVDVNGKSLYPDVRLDATNITLIFGSSYAASTFRVVVTG